MNNTFFKTQKTHSSKCNEEILIFFCFFQVQEGAVCVPGGTDCGCQDQGCALLGALEGDHDEGTTSLYER
jgi:hypothetical protein